METVENEWIKIRDLVWLLHKLGRSNKRILKTVKELYPGYDIQEDIIKKIINRDEYMWKS